MCTCQIRQPLVTTAALMLLGNSISISMMDAKSHEMMMEIN